MWNVLVLLLMHLLGAADCVGASCILIFLYICNASASVQIHFHCCLGRKCSLETSRASKCAGELHWTSCPLCGNPLDDVVHACTHRLPPCRANSRGADSEWKNFENIASVEGYDLCTVRPGSTKFELKHDNMFKI
jgi:hypothetical protein